MSTLICVSFTNGADKLDALKKTAVHLAAQPKKKQEGKIVEMPDRAEVVSV